MHFTKSNIQVLFLHIPISPHLVSFWTRVNVLGSIRQNIAECSDSHGSLVVRDRRNHQFISLQREVDGYSIFLYTLFVTRCPFITGGRRPSERLPCSGFFIRNAPISGRLSAQHRSIALRAVVIQSPTTVRHAPRPFETYCSVCARDKYTLPRSTHTPFVSFVFTVLRISMRFKRSVKRGPKTGLTRTRTFHGSFNDNLLPLWYFGQLILFDLFLSVRSRNIVYTHSQLDFFYRLEYHKLSYNPRDNFW